MQFLAVDASGKFDWGPGFPRDGFGYSTIEQFSMHWSDLHCFVHRRTITFNQVPGPTGVAMLKGSLGAAGERGDRSSSSCYGVPLRSRLPSALRRTRFNSYLSEASSLAVNG